MEARPRVRIEEDDAPRFGVLIELVLLRRGAIVLYRDLATVEDDDVGVMVESVAKDFVRAIPCEEVTVTMLETVSSRDATLDVCPLLKKETRL